MKTGLYIILLLLFASCEIQYGMLDNSIEADSFSVDIFEEQAANAPAGYGADFTEFLRDFLVSRSKMKMKSEKADIEISGKLKSYFTTPAAIQSDEVAALNSLKVTFQISVVNNNDEKQSFEQNFNAFSNYESSSDLSSVEDALLDDINERLSQDVLSKLSSNW
jgi:hypothetical protein